MSFPKLWVLRPLPPSLIFNSKGICFNKLKTPLEFCRTILKWIILSKEFGE